ncbi:MAG: hypothetical protein Ct9H300mP26_1530 [Acidimicrobiales bacterium]|nr:MAG: hypothetical protein Ct9H300mP26_1530 [Acidimicrobiales bacterium]
MLESFLVVGESVGVIVEEFNGDGEEVIEIHSACCAEASLVFVVDLCDFPIENAVGSFKCCVGGYEFIFEVRDVCLNASGDEFFVVKP